MNPLLIAQLIEALASVAQEGMALYTNGKTVLSETDLQVIHAALLKAEAATAALRPQVDAALDAASKA